MARSCTGSMMWSLLSVLLAVMKFAPGVSGIECYVCDSSNQIGCAEFLSDTSLLEPQPCDNVYDAQYCVKMTQVFEVGAIDCYQCDTVSDLACGERFDVERAAGLGVRPRPCSHIYGAQHCIKATGLFAGQLGTKRFCSARSFGNYCEWVKRPGDENTYQACVLTCSTSACNSSAGLRGAALLVAVTTALGLVGWTQAVR